MPTTITAETTRDELRLAAFQALTDSKHYAIASPSRHGLLLEAKLLFDLAETAPLTAPEQAPSAAPDEAPETPAAISDAGNGPEGTGGEAVKPTASAKRTARTPKATVAKTEEAAK